MYIVLDIETGDPTPEEQEQERKRAKIGRLKDPEKIAKKRAEVKMGCTDSAPIFCIGLKTPDKFISLSTANLGNCEREQLTASGVLAVTLTNEKDLLTVFAGVMSGLPNETRLVTFNGKNFDVRKLRHRMAMYGIQQPDALWIWKHTDAMLKAMDFLQVDTPFNSLEYVAESFKVPFRKGIDGGDIGKMIATDDPQQHTAILLYNMVDCLVTEQIARMMLGGRL